MFKFAAAEGLHRIFTAEQACHSIASHGSSRSGARTVQAGSDCAAQAVCANQQVTCHLQRPRLLPLLLLPWPAAAALPFSFSRPCIPTAAKLHLHPPILLQAEAAEGGAAGDGARWQRRIQRLLQGWASQAADVLAHCGGGGALGGGGCV